MKKLNKKVLAGAGLGALALVGGTFAYYNATLSLDNPLNTGKYNTQLVEEFTPPTEELKPGQKWDKVVGAENTGDYPVLVRVKMEEKWSRGGSNYKELVSSDSKFNNGTYDSSKGVFDANQVNDGDGLTPEGDGTVVHKNILTTNGWIAGSDGYWYWNGVLEKKGAANGKDKTSAILDGLVLAEDIDLGVYNTSEYYQITLKGAQPTGAWTPIGTITDINGDGKSDVLDLVATKNSNGETVTPIITVDDTQTLHRKSESKIDENLPGYADSNYTLTVTAEFVQATTDAVWSGFDLSTLSNVETDGVHIVNK